MRALATFIFACFLCACADNARGAGNHSQPGHSPVDRIVVCAKSLGFAKCLKALSSWRAENAIEAIRANRDARFSLSDDVERFPWERYTNATNEQLDIQLCDGTEKLLEYRQLKLDVFPGYSFSLKSKGNGTLNVDVLTNPYLSDAKIEIHTNEDEDGTGRSSTKKIQKQFYRILPMLIVPGLIMSAILPFVLPALKMMTMAAVMINNMAFTGAIFTLLRNNAFTDYNYNHKVVYVNKGYKNEKRSPFYAEAESHIVQDQAEPQLSDVHTHDFDNFPNEFDAIQVEEYPTNTALLKEYYGENPKTVNSLQEKSEKRLKRRKSGRRKNRVKKRAHQTK